MDFVRARLGKFSDLAFRLKDFRAAGDFFRWRKRGDGTMKNGDFIWWMMVNDGYNHGFMMVNDFNHEKLGPNHEKWGDFWHDFIINLVVLSRNSNFSYNVSLNLGGFFWGNVQLWLGWTVRHLLTGVNYFFFRNMVIVPSNIGGLTMKNRYGKPSTTGYIVEQQTGNLPSNMGRDWRIFVSVIGYYEMPTWNMGYQPINQPHCNEMRWIYCAAN